MKTVHIVWFLMTFIVNAIAVDVVIMDYDELDHNEIQVYDYSDYEDDCYCDCY